MSNSSELFSQDLKKEQIIGYKTKDDLIVVDFRGERGIEIDGFSLDKILYNSNDKEVVFKFGEEHKIERVYYHNETIGYTNGTEQISPEEFHFKLKEVDKRTDDEWSDTQIEEEFAYRKFINAWKPVVKENVRSIIAVYELKILNLPYSEYECIEPLCHFGGNISSALFMYRQNMVSIFQEIAKKYGFEKMVDDTSYRQTEGLKYSFHRDGSLEYMTINGGYISDNIVRCTRHNGGFKGTYEECVKKYKEDCKIIDDYLYGIKTKETKHIGTNLKELINRLQEIHTRVSNLQVKKDSINERITLITIINELKAKVLADASDTKG